jgi:hypothetical protein
MAKWSNVWGIVDTMPFGLGCWQWRKRLLATQALVYPEGSCQGAKILWRRRIKSHRRARCGMFKSQMCSMEHLAQDGLWQDRDGAAPTVERIAKDWVPEVSEVHADLMRSAGVEMATDESGVLGLVEE